MREALVAKTALSAGQAHLWWVRPDAITDPAVLDGREAVFGDTMVYCVPGFWNPFARLMEPATCKQRIIERLGPGTVSIIKITNYRSLSGELDDCIMPYHLLYEKA